MADFSWPQLMLTAATSIASVWGGAKLARYQSDINRQRAEKQAAAALRADLQRIDASLGKSANAFGATFHGLRVAPPTVHRWSEPIVVQLAAADPRIVAGYMDLDRELGNLAVQVAGFFQAADLQEQARAHLKGVKSTFEPIEDALLPNQHLQFAAERLNAEGRVEQAAEAVREAIAEMREPHRKAKAIVAELLRLTSAIVDARDREFLQLPEEI